MTQPIPTPNDMPGAATPNSGEATAEETTAPPDDPNADPADETPSGPKSLDDMSDEELRAEVERLRHVHKDERRWERQAKKNQDDAKLWRENADKVKQWDELTEKQKSDLEKALARAEAAERERDSERTERLREKVAAELKVPAKRITGTTEDEMRESAEEYKAERDADIDAKLKELGVAPAAPADQVTSDGKATRKKQLTRADLQGMTPAQINAAYKEGQLDQLQGITT
jgi:hypothetical protein